MRRLTVWAQCSSGQNCLEDELRRRSPRGVLVFCSALLCSVAFCYAVHTDALEYSALLVCCCLSAAPTRPRGLQRKRIGGVTYHVALGLAVVTLVGAAILGLEVGGNSALGGHCDGVCVRMCSWVSCGERKVRLVFRCVWRGGSRAPNKQELNSP